MYVYRAHCRVRKNDVKREDNRETIKPVHETLGGR